jgi:bacterioferritin (cytochrome b1)
MQNLTNESLANLLNEDLALELRAIVQNINHIGTAVSSKTNELAKDALHERINFVVELTSQITRMGCIPITHISPPHVGRTTKNALIEDLSLEKILLARYLKRQQQAEKLESEPILPKVVESRISEVSNNISRLETVMSRHSDRK